MYLINRFWEETKDKGFLSAISLTHRYLRKKYTSLSRSIKLNKLRIVNDSKIVKEINKSKMELDISKDSNQTLEKDLALNGVREPGSTRKFEQVLEELKSRHKHINVLDIGANVGYFALLEAHILGNSGTIYAIEAERENIKHLKRNVELNDYSNIKIIHKAVGEENTKTNLSISQASNTHKISKIDTENSNEQSVEMITIDKLITEHNISKDIPLVIRMDIEGYENYAFEGMKDLLNSKQPIYIMIEIHDRSHNPIKTVLNTLKRNRFCPEYVSYDGGKTIEDLNDFEINVSSNIHIMASKSFS